MPVSDIAKMFRDLLSAARGRSLTPTEAYNVGDLLQMSGMNRGDITVHDIPHPVSDVMQLMNVGGVALDGGHILLSGNASPNDPRNRNILLRHEVSHEALDGVPARQADPWWKYFPYNSSDKYKLPADANRPEDLNAEQQAGALEYPEGNVPDAQTAAKYLKMREMMKKALMAKPRKKSK